MANIGDNPTKEIAKLIVLLQEKMDEEQNIFFSCLEFVLADAIEIQEKMAVRDEDIVKHDYKKERRELRLEIDAFVIQLKEAYQTFYETKGTYYLFVKKRDQDYGDYLNNLFQYYLDSLKEDGDPFYYWAKSKSGGNIDFSVMKEKCFRWYAISGQVFEERRQEIGKRIKSLWALKALLIGALRLCGIEEKEVLRRLASL